MIGLVYIILLVHTVASLVFGYVLREIDEKEPKNSDSWHIMVFVIGVEVITFLGLIGYMLENVNFK